MNEDCGWTTCVIFNLLLLCRMKQRIQTLLIVKSVAKILVVSQHIETGDIFGCKLDQMRLELWERWSVYNFKNCFHKA